MSRNGDAVVLDSADTPAAIEARSFEIIDSEIAEPRPYTGKLWTIARRCIHALGDLSIAGDLFLDEKALESGLAAMRTSCTIFTDTSMLAAGLVARRMSPLGVHVQSLMSLPGIEANAKAGRITRAKAGIRMIADLLGGQIVAIGNAPTALLALLEEVERHYAAAPALIVGMPVGFVNAAQSKELLRRSNLPCFTLLGRKGGSAAAAACVNALAELVLEERGIRLV